LIKDKPFKKKMNPHDLSQLAGQAAAVARLLKTELGNQGRVSAAANQIIVSISRFQLEHHLGNILQQIYRTVDQHFPVRRENLSLIIRDTEGLYQNSFKIWKSL
jgi:hypothetical protein